MARLRIVSQDDSEPAGAAVRVGHDAAMRKAVATRNPGSLNHTAKSTPRLGMPTADPTKDTMTAATSATAKDAQRSRQRPLKQITGNSLLAPLPGLERAALGQQSDCKDADPKSRTIRQTPRRTAKHVRSNVVSEVTHEDTIAEEAASSPADASYQDEDESSRGSESESDDSLEAIKFWGGRNPVPTPRHRKTARRRVPFPSPSLVPQRSTPEPAVDSQQSSDTIELTSPSPQKKLPTIRPPFHAPSSSRPTTSDGDHAAVLTFEPPTTRSPRKAPPRSKTPPASTPPPSPSKGKLLSPSKRAQRIAAAPFRPSIDAFWSPTMVNEWNDQYSPKKECLTSPRKKRFGDLLNRGNNESGNSSDNEAYPSPSTSPKKSPKKRDNAAAKRKDFEAAKHEIAEAFIRELDEHITDGKIAELAKETGGVKLVWSKRLNTTAGRANWRRDHIGKTLPDGTKVTTRFRHSASIELAEKVIDNEERLINILAHEWCHLANFMVSDIRDRPHGKEFQEWAVKTSRAFASRGVQVTTKHSYEIDYKYAWECEQCGLVYQRHSKSIDPKKVSCGACRSKLCQIKPKPRGGAASGYAGFVKENFATVKSENPGASHGVVMERLGKLYKERKAASATPSSSASIGDRLNGAVDDIAEALGVVVIDD